MHRTFTATLLLCLITLSAFAQEPLKPKQSPLDMRTYKFEDGTYMKVIYSRPHKRGREVFGELVPYDKIWRTGANQATELTITGPVWFGEQALAAGTYTVFSIPQKDQWTLILNGDLGQWGAFNYAQDQDVLRVTVPVVNTPESWEPFTIDFEQFENHVDMVLIWDRTKVAVSISQQEQ
ncbi:MAG TPA: hypothetical protein DCE41_04480 [Cytophagales bacterium]|nr:hypothetical protein [Cytophagales bacterium]HAP60000.1 hypothetical protein [Cytophagales bacterium]